MSNKNARTLAAKAGSSNGHVSLEPKEQAKLDAIAAEYIATQQRLTLTQEFQNVEAQRNRLQGVIEAALGRRDLDPAIHRWDYDGKTVTLRRA
jgi:hypothetical protein